MARTSYDDQLAFHGQLWDFYNSNRGKIRSRYNDLTKKFLAYNDSEENPDAFLRKPQFEALEMYIFIKEFLRNKQVYEIFDEWRKREGVFADTSYYSVESDGQITIGRYFTEEQMDTIFKQMKEYQEDYPNYIYGLTMGLGKTVLMATCIFYEFLLAKKYPRDERFCHNALVFAPDKTVLQSLKEIMTFDKTKVVPVEYAGVLDANIKFHFLEDTGTILHTIDDSDYNIVISNTQKIILKKKHTEDTAAQRLFKDNSSLLAALYGDDNEDEADDLTDDSDLIDNQRFRKICRLPKLGVYVDEAHHLFGADLEKQIRSNSGKTSLRDTINHIAGHTSIVACYNYTGTPYVKNQVLPEVVYAYGLRESIWEGFLKDADPIGYDNVKEAAFLRDVISVFWERYGKKKYEGLHPKLAIYASGVEEAVKIVRPEVEKILSKMGIDTSRILVNVGDEKYTKDEDVRNFNNLDVPGSEGDKKQFIILVEKGKEGWNCRSLFGVALFRSPKSKVFVLQATMRCMRAITDEPQQATVFLSKDNFDTLDAELHKNFNMDIKDITRKKSGDKKPRKVQVMPPPRTITMKRIWREYKLVPREYKNPINFDTGSIDMSKYESIRYEADSLARDTTVKKENVDYLQEQMQFSLYSLSAEVARYLNISCFLAEQIIEESVDGADRVLAAVNQYNQILYDVIVPNIFHVLYEIKVERRSEDRELVLLKEPEGKAYYTFSAKDDLVATIRDRQFTDAQKKKSFHADTYCFDSKPEYECFQQYLVSDKVKEVYFTGMFTANQGDLSISYYDPNSGRVRQYYPDFLAKMEDGSYQLIEVKADFMKDDPIVKAKQDAAEEMASESDMKYILYTESEINNTHILEK